MPLESNFLVPDQLSVVAYFAVCLAALLLVVGLLVIVPLVETIERQQWGYTLGVLVFGPMGGLVWFIVGRRETASKLQAIH